MCDPKAEQPMFNCREEVDSLSAIVLKIQIIFCICKYSLRKRLMMEIRNNYITNNFWFNIE